MRSNAGALVMPAMATRSETRIPRMMDWTAALDAPSLSCSPMRRATKAVVDMLRPMATPKTSVNRDSVMPTVAMASAPRRETKKASTMPNKDSMHISRIMGMARRRMARFRSPLVKS
jgi:hypothetical protein